MCPGSLEAGAAETLDTKKKLTFNLNIKIELPNWISFQFQIMFVKKENLTHIQLPLIQVYHETQLKLRDDSISHLCEPKKNFNKSFF